MDKIGECLQYTVYDEGERVRKEPKSREEMVKMAMNWYDTRSKAEENVELALERISKALDKIRENNVPEFIFGNVEIEGGTVYQDKLIPVHDKLESLDTLEEKKKVIDDYIGLLQTLWSYGIGDTIYNFTLNNGYDDMGRLVQLDFGEIVFSKQIVKNEIRDEKWLEMRSYSHDISNDLKPYFKKRMSEEITVEKLEDKWRRNLN